jgi:hypothetical protein
MQISEIFRNGNLAPDEIELLESAYRQTLRSLGLVDRDDPIAEMVAKTIIEIGATGVRDPREIAVIALRQLRIQG